MKAYLDTMTGDVTDRMDFRTGTEEHTDEVCEMLHLMAVHVAGFITATFPDRSGQKACFVDFVNEAAGYLQTLGNSLEAAEKEND